MPALHRAPSTSSSSLLSIAHTCERFGIHRTTLWRWRKEGRLRAVQIGGVIRFRAAEVERLIHEHEAAPL